MDHGSFQHLLTSNIGDCLSNPVTCTDSKHSLVVQDFANQLVSYNAKHIDAVTREISQQMYDAVGEFETVETLSTVVSREQSLRSTQNKQTNVDRTMYPSFASHDLIPIADFPSVSTTFVSHETISHDGPDHDVSFVSTTDDAAKRRKDRRRAQNRSAQRAFRARKEEAIKKSAVKVQELLHNLAWLQSANAGLSETADNLKAQVLRLQAENAVLEQWRLSMVSSLNDQPCIAPQKCGMG